VIHGWGAPEGLTDKIRECFPADLDVIIHGHTHIAKKEQADGTLLFNPGSAIGRPPASYASYGLITIDNENGLQAEIVRL
jgi:predicted phosphodiesterase